MSVPNQVTPILSPQAAAVLAQAERTEDVRLSPDGTRLIIAGFTANNCLLFDFHLDQSTGQTVPHLTRGTVITSDTFSQPHGIDFVGDHHLAIANRNGFVELYALPDTAMSETMHLRPRRTLRRASLVHSLSSPGSLVSAPAPAGKARLFVCNNYAHCVTEHIFSLTRHHLPARNHIALDRGFVLPDGVTLSPDGRWLAISSHNTRCIVIYDMTRYERRRTIAAGFLFGVLYPHGMRFSADGRRLYVSDAGTPNVSVFHSDDGTWDGPRDPLTTLRVMDDETFQRGNYNPQEGGAKGVELASDLLITTCEHQPLSFLRLEGEMLP